MSTPLIIKLVPTTNNEPGHALFRLPKNWEGEQNPLYLTVQNSNTNEYLQTAQNTVNVWEATSCEWVLTGFQEVNGQLQLQLGSDIIDPLLEASSQSPTYAITLRDEAGYKRSGGLLFHADSSILPSNAKSETAKRSAMFAPHPANVSLAAHQTEQAPVVTQEPTPEPEAVSEFKSDEHVTQTPPPIAVSSTAAQPKSKKWLGLLLALLLLLVAAGIAFAVWSWLKKGDKDSDTTALTEPAVAAVTACDPSKMTGQSDVEFIQACLKDKPDSALLLQIIDQAKTSGHCSIAQRLYANRSQSGDSVIAAAYVKEYDPKFHEKSNCFPEPNAATAKYWYESILANEPNNAEAKQRLDELNQ